jgi:hypothetical protein
MGSTAPLSATELVGAYIEQLHQAVRQTLA